MPFVIALDQGTTSSRAIVFDEAAQIVGTSQREFEQHFPQAGWVEHDPLEIWNTQLDVAVDAIAAAKLQPTDISAIGITNQRETTVVWDRSNGQPIHNAIVWQDRRTAPTCEALKAEGKEAMIREKTGLVLDPYFSATKVAWILDHVNGARSRAERGELAFGTIDAWLIYQLTGGAVHMTDASNASRTMLFDVHTGTWDQQLCDVLSVPREVLPQIGASSFVCGEVASALPIAGIPIGGFAGDQQSALFGQACFASGQSKNTYGTGCFMLRHTGSEPIASQNQLLTTVAWQLDDTLEYALEGSVFMGGAIVQWLRDGLKLIKSASDIESLARSVDDTAGVYLVPALTGLGAPHWDPYARGLLIGLTRGTTAAHVARAALEGIALQVADLSDAMSTDCGQQLSELRVDGGASNNNLLMQIQADLVQAPIVRPSVTETTALGAAYLAGLATGVWTDQQEIAQHWQQDRVFEPTISHDEAQTRRHRWNEALQRSKSWETDG